MAPPRIGEYSSVISVIEQYENYHMIKKIKKPLKSNKEQDYGQEKGKLRK